jgi:hypothetical protein
MCKGMPIIFQEFKKGPKGVYFTHFVNTTDCCIVFSDYKEGCNNRWTVGIYISERNYTTSRTRTAVTCTSFVKTNFLFVFCSLKYPLLFMRFRPLDKSIDSVGKGTKGVLQVVLLLHRSKKFLIFRRFATTRKLMLPSCYRST